MPIGLKRGIAVIGADESNGIWQYSKTGGEIWHFVGGNLRSSERALLLPGWYLLRFLPNPDFTGTATITYRAWDQTLGTAEEKRSVVGLTGGANAFSEEVEAASQWVSPVNDAPLLDVAGNPTLESIKEDTRNSSGMPVWRLSLGSGFGIDSNNNVLSGTTIIGERTSSGFGTNELVITFRSTATRAIVQQLLRSITFKTVGARSAREPFCSL